MRWARSGWLVFSTPLFPLLSSSTYAQPSSLPACITSDSEIHRNPSTEEEEEEEGVMSSSSRASFVVAASISAVEALKDQAGLCRWNYLLRSVGQRARNSAGSMSSQGKRASSSIDRRRELWKGEEGRKKAKQSEEALRTVMYLSCWAPN